MSRVSMGELIPRGGGDAIPLLRPTLKVGRRESSDICLRFPNISGTHCELTYRDGYWVIRDLNSTNGIKVNGQRLRFRPLRPGDLVTIGKRDYTIQYELVGVGLKALEAVLTESEDMLNQSLMEKAGLTKASRLNPYGMVEGPRKADEDGDDDAAFDDDDD
jgi:adenylate cyclase